MAFTYKFPRPALTVDCLIIDDRAPEIKILLIKRDNPPFEATWALPGGFVEMHETLNNAALRELEEETGIKGIKLEQLYTFDAINRDPRGRTISVVFLGYIINDPEIRASSDAREVKWFFIKNLPTLAFDHKEIIEFGIGKGKA